MASTFNGGASGPATPARFVETAHTALEAALAQRDVVAAQIGRAAVHVARDWLLEHNRPLIRVEVFGQLAIPDTDEALNDAVGHLPRELLSAGLDIRGEYIVRLADLNAYLGRDRDDRTPVTMAPHPAAAAPLIDQAAEVIALHTAWMECDGDELADEDARYRMIDAGLELARAVGNSTTPPRIEIFGERDPDGDTDIDLYINGQLTRAEQYILDAGAGYDWSDWVDSRASEIACASPALAARLYERSLDPCGGQYVEDKPDTPEECARELDELIAQYRSKGDRA